MSLRRAFFFAGLTCFFLVCICPAQSFLFVSPNTRDHMTDESALGSMDSFEQSNFLAAAKFLAAKICAKPNVQAAEGMDGANTENSSLITGCNTAHAQYLGELLGRYAHQKWILVFDPVSGSKGRLLTVSFTTEHPADVPKLLRSFGIKAGTIVAQDKQVRFFLWAPDQSLDPLVRLFAGNVQGTIRETPGKATFIGNDSRAKARQIFDQRIHQFERAHPKHSLSQSLWTKQLHDLGLTSTP